MIPNDRAVILVSLLFGDSEHPAYDPQRARGCERPIQRPALVPAAVLDAITSQP